MTPKPYMVSKVLRQQKLALRDIKEMLPEYPLDCAPLERWAQALARGIKVLEEIQGAAPGPPK